MKKRPVNLNLATLKFPIPAIISILHRISGVILFLFIPGFLILLGSSLKSPEQFDRAAQWLSFFPIKVILWVGIVALIYHLFAGIRHLLMDFGLGESLRAGRMGSWIVLILTAVVTILLGLRLW